MKGEVYSMANVIELVSKYIPVLDYQYRVESKTAILDADEALVRETRDAKTVLIPKMHLTGLRNYSRNEGFKRGNQELVWEPHTFTQDRGTEFIVDIMDDIETLGVAYGKLALEFQRNHVIPELDAYRFATYFEKAYNKDTTKPTKSNIFSLLNDAMTELDEQEVPEEGRVLYVSNQTYNFMKQSTEVQKVWEVRDFEDEKGISFKVEFFDGIRVIRVPQRRFKTAIEILDTDLGGYEPAEGAGDINFLLLHPSAIMQIVKRAVTRPFAPTPELAAQTGAWGVNQKSDGWLLQERVYHDAFVLGNKTVALFTNYTPAGS